jgi:hypothetical protein
MRMCASRTYPAAAWKSANFNPCRPVPFRGLNVDPRSLEESSASSRSPYVSKHSFSLVKMSYVPVDSQVDYAVHAVDEEHNTDSNSFRECFPRRAPNLKLARYPTRRQSLDGLSDGNAPTTIGDLYLLGAGPYIFFAASPSDR